VKIVETRLSGAFLLEPERLEDERGFFARTWSRQQLADHGLDSRIAECSISFNRTKGTLRGMHYQAPPNAEVKLVRCTAGAIYDCIIDLRRTSPTFKEWIVVELTAQNRVGMYVPEDFAHGFLTLEDESEVYYQISEAYAPESARGVRWDDPAFDIDWPEPVRVMNERDRNYEDFEG
jgi:dTDP-4-dehydrorhamnose 3,5-epimerase